MRIAYYAINGVGLGHLARTVAIAKALGADRHEHLFLTSSPAVEILRREGLPFVQFPSDALVSSKALPLKDKTYSRVLAGLVGVTLNHFDPHVLVVDTVPFGVRNELAIATTAARRSAFVLRERGGIDPATAAAINAYDLVIMPHDGPGVPQGIDADKVEHVGAIVLGGAGGMRDKVRARQALGLGGADKPTVGVAFGGGGDPNCSELLAWAARAAGRHPAFHFALSVPPLLRGAPPAALPPNASIVTRSPLADVWSAFDFAISAAGYNSTNELLRAGVPAIFVPLERPLDDQFARARRCVENGAALQAVAFDDESLDLAIGSMESEAFRATMSDAARGSIVANGAENAAQALNRLVQ